MAWTSDFRRRLATRSDRLVTLVTAILLVASGYLLGLWTAESRKEVPIVFQSSSSHPDDVLSPQDLEHLTQSATASSSPPETPGAVKSEETRKNDEAFLASVSGTKYYFPDCAEVRRIKEENRITFASEQEARDAGYEPSACVERRRNNTGE